MSDISGQMACWGGYVWKPMADTRGWIASDFSELIAYFDSRAELSLGVNAWSTALQYLSLCVRFVRCAGATCPGSCFFPPAARGAPSYSSSRRLCELVAPLGGRNPLGGPSWPDEVNAGGWVQWPALPTTDLEFAAKKVCKNV